MIHNIKLGTIKIFILLNHTFTFPLVGEVYFQKKFIRIQKPWLIVSTCCRICEFVNATSIFIYVGITLTNRLNFAVKQSWFHDGLMSLLLAWSYNTHWFYDDNFTVNMCNAEEVLIGITWLTIDNYHKQKQNQKDFKNRASEFYFISKNQIWVIFPSWQWSCANTRKVCQNYQ